MPPAALLLEPTYGYADRSGNPYRPSTREVWREWCDALDLRHSRGRWLGLAFFTFHVLTGAALLASFAFFSWRAVLFGVVVHQWVSLVYHTFWYHRYCSHGAFAFSSRVWPRLLLWTNPVLLREETYCIPHRIHHQRSDTAGDPYGPHLGWLGSYLSWESLQKTNPDLSPAQYETLQRSLAHIGFPSNDLDGYRRTGSVERVGHYVARTIVAQTLFASAAYVAGGVPTLLAAYGAVFVFTFLLRDFPWRGHGGETARPKVPGWEFDARSRSTNNRFYGYLAAEWHDNHHRFPTSANCAFLPGQVDVVFAAIRLLRRAGIVSRFTDAGPRFEGTVLRVSPRAHSADQIEEAPFDPVMAGGVAGLREN